jgi:hypothetical protein
MKPKSISIICFLSMYCHAAEYTMCGKVVGLMSMRSVRVPQKRKNIELQLRCLKKRKQSEIHESVAEKISPIKLGGRMLDLLCSLFPSVLARIMFEYSGCEDGDFIAYFNTRDGSYTRYALRNQNSFLREVDEIEIFGINSNHLPMVRTCAFSDKPVEVALRYYPSGNQLKDWDYLHIRDTVRRSFCDERTAQHFIDYTCRYTLENGMDEQLTELPTYTVAIISRLLAHSSIAVCKKDSSVVQRGQKNSLLCGVPGMGPREFAQLLKNAALYFASVRATLPTKSFITKDSIYGMRFDAVVDRYPLYKPFLDQVINDSTGALALVFF